MSFTPDTKTKPTGRPTLDDVERISRGQAAKRRGTGSRQVPHRLNAEEAKAFQIAKKRRYVVVRGSGVRRERRGSPLVNTFRQYCDHFGWPCVIVEQGTGSDNPDVVAIDTSPTRVVDPSEMLASFATIAEECGASLLDSDSNIGGPRELVGKARELQSEAAGAKKTDLPTEADLKNNEESIASQGDVIRALKAEGNTNTDQVVKDEVAVLKDLKAIREEMLQRLEDAKGEEEALFKQAQEEDRLRLEEPIWQLPTIVTRFQCPEGRPQARRLAELLPEHFITVS